MTKLALLSILLPIQGFTQVPHDLCLDLIGDCSYYSCVSQNRACVEQDYPESFARPYCEKFVQDQILYSVSGQFFLREIRECLQIKFAENQHQATCRQFRRQAHQHHVDCYLTSGFCKLPKKDKARLLRTIAREFKHRDFLNTAWRIEKSCFQLNRN